MCGTQQGTGRGSGCPAVKGHDPRLLPEKAVGLMREGTPGHKGILHHQGQTLPSSSLQGSPSSPLSQSPLYRAGGCLEEEPPVSSLRHCRPPPDLVGNFSAAAFVGELRRGLAGGSWQGWDRGQLPAGEGERGSSPLPATPPGNPGLQDPTGYFKSSLWSWGTQILPCPLNPSNPHDVSAWGMSRGSLTGRGCQGVWELGVWPNARWAQLCLNIVVRTGGRLGNV